MPESLNYQPSNSAVYYTPPKVLNLPRTLVAFPVTAFFAAVGSAVYALIQPHISNEIARMCAVVVAAIAVGVLGISPVRYGRVYSPIIAGFIGAAMAMFSLYVMWLVWVHQFLARFHLLISWSTLIFHPMVFRGLINGINRNGAWTYNDRIVRGPELYVYWLGEAAAILACGVLFPIRGVSRDDLICRECYRRCVRTRRLPRFAADRESELVASIENRDFSSLLSHQKPQDENDPELSLTLISCPSCARTHVLTLNKIAWSIDANRRLKVKTIPLVNRMLVTAAEADEIKNLCKLINKQREEAKQLNPAEACTQHNVSDEPGKIISS